MNTAEVSSNLQLLGFGGRDAGDATATSYYLDNGFGDAHWFSTLYDGFFDIYECELDCDLPEDCATATAITCGTRFSQFGRLYIWTAEDMGTLQLNGPGYSGATANADYSNVNSGSLIYDCTTGNHLKWYCGYGAHVDFESGNSYDISGLTSSTEGVKFVLRKLDRVYSTGSITLNICVGDNCGTCELQAQDSLQAWYGHNGVHANAAPNACDTLYESLR